VSFASLAFLFLFLPLCLFSYHLAPSRLKNTVLLCMSLVFYAWGEGFFVAVMLASIAGNGLLGALLAKLSGSRNRRVVLALAVAMNLGLLGVYKYANFAVDVLNHALEAAGIATLSPVDVHLPIGISFFTFQALSYVIDVYRRDAPAQTNPVRLALYISLFPQLVAGPIVRYGHVARQLGERRVDLDGFSSGVARFIAGLAKKVLVANSLAVCADGIFALPAEHLTTSLAWIGSIAYALQIYFDFSGYSDMAIGLGRMFGFHFPENFDRPYVARSIAEFWRRWHISLSSWFRDYLYIPLGGNRRSPARVHLNLIVVFALCGLWHGASVVFLVWGLYHGALLIAERSGLRAAVARLPAVLQHAYALLAILVGWVLFRAEDLGHAAGFLAAMFGAAPFASEAHPARLYVTNQVALMAIVGCVAATPVAPRLLDLWRRLDGASALLPRAVAQGAAFAWIGIFVLSIATLAAGTHNPFIYFRF
jgi:alginate O-acetyltransferase complex protein AlgI